MDRQRLKSAGYILLSIFIIWHAIGIAVVGPTAQSYMRQGLMKIYKPYLTLLNLNRSWPFYAPNPFLGSILEYETVNTAGETSVYPLTKTYEKHQHAYFRYTNFYAYLFSNPEQSKSRGYDKSVARYLCSQHPGEIESINFILWKQKLYTFRDYQAGKKPLDPVFLEKETFGPYHCIDDTQ